MASTVRERILKVFAAKALGYFLTMATHLVSVPLLLFAWNAQLFGEWLILNTFPVYFELGNLGFAHAAVNEMTMFVARGRRRPALKSFQSAWIFLMALSFGLALLASALIWHVPMRSWFRLESMGNPEAQCVVLLLLAYVLVGFQMGLLSAGFRCEAVFHRGVMFTNLTRILELAALVTVVLLGAGPTGAAAALLGGRITGALIMRLDLRRRASWIVFGFRHASWAEIKRLAGPSFGFALMPLGRALSNQGVVLGIASILGARAVVAFSTLRMMANLIHQGFGLINQSFWSEISMAYGTGRGDLIRKLHRYACRVSIWFCLAAVAGLLVLGPWIYGIWTQGKVEMVFPVFLGFLSVMMLRSFWYTSFIIPSAVNRHQRLAVRFLIASALGCAAAIVLLPPMGLMGGIVGLILIEVVMIAGVLPVAMNLAEDTITQWLGSLTRPPYPRLVRRRPAGPEMDNVLDRRRFDLHWK